MYTKRNYGFWLTFNWSKMPFIYGFLYAGLIVIAHHVVLNYHDIDISLPWQPISVLGIAVAFYLGFKNNSSYDRTWEARKIYGAIVNNSRSFGAAVNAFLQGNNKELLKKELIYRHIAWLTALRFQLRLTRDWEHKNEAIKGICYFKMDGDYNAELERQLTQYVSKEEVAILFTKENIATQILNNQSLLLQKLKNEGYYDDFRHMELYKLIASFYDEQGKSERIKNFPFPRQYASASLWQSIIFSLLIPFGMLNIFSADQTFASWLAVPFSALIIWSFFLMEKIGDYSENPFEGSYNDIPITSISRAIEIDIRQMINDTDIPKPIKSIDGYLM